MEKKVSTRSNMQRKKTRNTNKVSEVQNVAKSNKKGAGRPKKQKDTLGQPYMKVIYTSGNYTEEVEFSPDKPLQGTSYFAQVGKSQHRALWFVLGAFVGGFVMWGLWKLVLLGVL